MLGAIAINTSNFFVKLLAWVWTGSHSMFSEAIHSLADTLNQMILAYGIHKSNKNPTKDHPYGYSNAQYVTALISGVGIFCLGAGLSVYHGIHGLLTPGSMGNIWVAPWNWAGLVKAIGTGSTGGDIEGGMEDKVKDLV